MATLVTGTGLDGKQYKRHRCIWETSNRTKETRRQASHVCLTVGAPSHFPMENRHQAAVVGRKPKMKKTDSEWLLP